jgi:predicted nuclease of predicted toxin-antitoxin system
VEFKVDENLPCEARQILHDAGHDAVTVLDQNLGGRSDTEIAAVCKSESRVLITLDTDFANILAYPPHEFAGIVVLRTEDQSKPMIVTYLRRLLTALATESPKGGLWIVESNRIRIRSSETHSE